jgi:hypothetical protein
MFYVIQYTWVMSQTSNVMERFTSKHYLMVSHQQTEDTENCYARTALDNTQTLKWINHPSIASNNTSICITDQTCVEMRQNKESVKSYTNGRHECSIMTTQKESNTVYVVLFQQGYVILS